MPVTTQADVARAISEMGIVYAARLKAAHEEPYYSSALYRMRVVETEAVPIMAVDKYWRVYINPNVKGDYTVGVIQGIWIHEEWHLLLDHPRRCEAIKGDPSKWNLAADLSINQHIRQRRTEMLSHCKTEKEKEMVVGLPDGVLYPELYQFPNDLSAEQYYELVCKDIEQNPNGQLAQMAKQLDDAFGRNRQASNGEGDGESDPNGTGMGFGSGADGVQRPWEIGDPTTEQDKTGDKTGMDSGEQQLYRRMVAGQMREYQTQTERENDRDRQKKRGTVPAYFQRWCDDVLAPAKVSWQSEMRAEVMTNIAYVKGMTDYSRARPNRRQQAYGNVIMPSMISPIPNVMVVLDTSGSMSQENLQDAVQEIDGILKSVGGIGVEFVSLDAGIHIAKRIGSLTGVDIKGGGGTDMRVGIYYAVEKKVDIVIVLTDGYTPWPEAQVGRVRVIAGIVGGYDGEAPKWIKTIHIAED